MLFLRVTCVLDQTLVHFAGQVSLATLWHTLRVTPQGAVGDGYGSLDATVITGALTVSEAVHLLIQACGNRSPKTSPSQKIQEDTFSISSVALLSPETLEVMAEIPAETDDTYPAKPSPLLVSSAALQGKGWNVAISMGNLPRASSSQFLFIPSLCNHAASDLTLAAALGAAFQAHIGVSAADIVSTTEPPMWIPPRALEEKLFWAPKPASSHDETASLPPDWSTVLQTARTQAQRAEVSLNCSDLSWEEAAADTLHTVYVSSALRELGFQNAGGPLHIR